MTEQIDRAEGRRLFGADPAAYHGVRPDYPEWIFTDLVQSGALFPGAATLEIGAGTGLATEHLLAHGARPLCLLEPDERFAAALSRFTSRTCTVQHAAFESASFAPGCFDLIVAATAFHWLEPGTAFPKTRTLLKPGGTLALMWNLFQVPGEPDPFHDATHALLAPLATSPSGAPDTLPFALDRAARQTEARAAGFEHMTFRQTHGSMSLGSHQIRMLYAGFSSIQRLPAADRDAVLTELERIAEQAFGGRVIRNVTSCLYCFR